MDKQKQAIAYFISFCIEQYKEKNHISGSETMEVFNRNGLLDYLEAHYEPLHTQSRQWILEEIDELIKERQKQ